MSPLFAIITVCRNCRRDLAATMASVDAQTCTDYEHFIVDGASSDGSPAMLAADRNPHRRFISEPDGGIYDAMNKGMDRSRGKYLIFLNAGDRFHGPDTLAAYARAIADTDPDIVYGQTAIVDAEGKFLGMRHLRAPEKLTLQSFAQGMLVCHQAMAVRRRIAPPYDTRFRFSADYGWAIVCLQHSRRNTGLGDTIVADYLRGGATAHHRLASLGERFRLMCRHYGIIQTIGRHMAFIPRAITRKLSRK